MSRPDALSEAELLHLVDRAEAGTLLADEAVLLREGIRSLAAARRSLGGLMAKQQRAAPQGVVCRCGHGFASHWHAESRCWWSGDGHRCPCDSFTAR